MGVNRKLRAVTMGGWMEGLPSVRKENVNGDVYSFDGDDRKGAA
jgi:hypothetical protein